MTYVERLTAWVEQQRPVGTFDHCDVTYRVVDSDGRASAHLYVGGPRRFVELLLGDTGEAELAVGARGEPGHGTYLELAHPDEIVHLTQRLEDTIGSWRRPAEVREPTTTRSGPAHDRARQQLQVEDPQATRPDSRARRTSGGA